MALILRILIFRLIYFDLPYMKIAVIGAGGVGGYFGGRLAMAKFDVTFLARGNHLKEIQKNGLQVKSINGGFIIENAQTTDRIHKIGFADIVILATKAWQVHGISYELGAIVKKDIYYSIRYRKYGQLKKRNLLQQLGRQFLYTVQPEYR